MELWSCPSCGSKNAGVVCWKCGAARGATGAPPPAPAAPPPPPPVPRITLEPLVVHPADYATPSSAGSGEAWAAGGAVPEPAEAPTWEAPVVNPETAPYTPPPPSNTPYTPTLVPLPPEPEPVPIPPATSYTPPAVPWSAPDESTAPAPAPMAPPPPPAPEPRLETQAPFTPPPATPSRPVVAPRAPAASPPAAYAPPASAPPRAAAAWSAPRSAPPGAAAGRAPAPSSSARTPLPMMRILVVAALLLIVVLVVLIVALTRHGTSLTTPSSIEGMPQIQSANAEALAQQARRNAGADGEGMLVGVYGDNDTASFIFVVVKSHGDLGGFEQGFMRGASQVGLTQNDLQKRTKDGVTYDCGTVEVTVGVPLSFCFFDDGSATGAGLVPREPGIDRALELTSSGRGAAENG